MRNVKSRLPITSAGLNVGRMKKRLIFNQKTAKWKFLMSKRTTIANKKQSKKTKPTSTVRKMLKKVPSLIVGLASNDRRRQLKSVETIRHYSRDHESIFFDAIIEAGLIPRLVQFLTFSGSTRLQFESAWTLTNLSSGSTEYVRKVVEAGAIPVLIDLINHRHYTVQEQAIWTLGNIAGDLACYRDIVIRYDPFTPILAVMIKKGIRESVLKNCVWTISNLIKGRSSVPVHLLKLVFPILAKLARTVDDDILEDICYGLSSVTQKFDKSIQMIIDSGICPYLIELIKKKKKKIALACIQTIANISAGTDEETQHIIDIGCISLVSSIIKQTKSPLRQTAMLILSNIASGNKKQIQDVIDSGLVLRMANLLGKQSEATSTKDICWVISNIGTMGNLEQRRYLNNPDIMIPYFTIIILENSELSRIIVKTIDRLLKYGKLQVDKDTCAENEFKIMVEDFGGLEMLELLQTGDDEELAHTSTELIESYWEIEEYKMVTIPLKTIETSTTTPFEKMINLQYSF